MQRIARLFPPVNLGDAFDVANARLFALRREQAATRSAVTDRALTRASLSSSFAEPHAENRRASSSDELLPEDSASSSSRSTGSGRVSERIESWPSASPLTVLQSLPIPSSDISYHHYLEQAQQGRQVSDDLINDATLRMYPDILLAMLRQERVAIGRIWLLCRYLDKDGRGWLPLDDVRSQLTQKLSPLRIVGKRRLRQILSAGRGVFWERDAQDRLWLYGIARVAEALEIARLQNQPVALPVAGLLHSLAGARAHCYAAFHSGRVVEPATEMANPISRQTLAGISGVCSRTQQRYDELAGVEVRRCFGIGVIHQGTESQRTAAWAHGNSTFLLTDRLGKQGAPNQTYLAWQLPNQYRGCHAKLKNGRHKKLNRRLRRGVNQHASDDLVFIRARGNGQMPEQTKNAETQRVTRTFFTDARQMEANRGQQPTYRLASSGDDLPSVCAIWQES